MPFVENAFKHVSRYSEGQNWITLDLSLVNNELQLLLSNSASPGDASATELIHYGGIGLKNVKRRLDLLYPGRHHLKITRNENTFQVELRVALNERAMAAAASAERKHSLTLIPEA